MNEIDTFKTFEGKIHDLSLEQLNSIWVPDQSMWQELSKDEIAIRKQEWKFIQRSLKEFASTEIRGSYIKAHKNLFFKGTVTHDDFSTYPLLSHSSFAGCYPLFYLWYLPKLTEEKCKEIVEYFCRPIFVMGEPIDLQGMRRAILSQVREFEYKPNGEYGFMGERMRMIAPLLLGEKGEKTRMDALSKYNRVGIGGGTSVIASTMACLRSPEYYCYSKFRYLWPQASYDLKEYITLSFEMTETLEQDPNQVDASTHKNNLRSFNIRMNSLIRTVEGFVHFDSHPDVNNAHPQAIACRDEIMAQYENGEFAEEMNKLFQMVKQKGMGKVTLDDVLSLVH